MVFNVFESSANTTYNYFVSFLSFPPKLWLWYFVALAKEVMLGVCYIQVHLSVSLAIVV